MVLLGDEAQAKTHFGLFGDGANLDGRYVHCLCRTYHRLINQFGHTQWNSKVKWVMWNLISACLDIVSTSVQDRCTVCAKNIIGSDIILDAPDDTPR